MKVGIIGDLHLGVRDANPVFMEHQIKWFERTLIQMRIHGIKTIIQVGDMFDKRKYTNNYLAEQVRSRIVPAINASGATFIKIRGNHEQFYRDSSAVFSDSILGASPSVKFVDDDYLQIGNMFLCNWMHKNNTDTILEAIGQTDALYAFGHFELADFPYYRGVMASHGMNADFLGKFAAVFSGHYHTVSTCGHVCYVGSPLHLTWADYPDGNERGYFVLETDTGEVEFVRNGEDDSLFIEIEYVDGMECDALATLLTGKLVRLRVGERNDRKYKAFRAWLAGVQMIDYTIVDLSVVTQSTSAKSAELVAGQDLDYTSVISEFVRGHDSEAVVSLADDVIADLLNKMQKAEQ